MKANLMVNANNESSSALKIGAFGLAFVLAIATLGGCASSKANSAAASSAAASAGASATASEGVEGGEGAEGGQTTSIPKGSMQVTVSIVSPDANNTVEYNDTVILPKGATALDTLKPTGLELDIQESAMGPFVQSIGGLANEGMKGWTYTVNTDQPTTNASDVVLKEGDLVEWAYIDMGK